MAASAWRIYDSFTEDVAKGVIDLDSHSFKLALFTSASDANDDTETAYGGLGSEVANGNGYTTGGIALSGVTVTRSGDVTTFDFVDPQFTASGGNIVFRFAVIYDNTPAGKPLVARCLPDSTPGDITILDGQTLTLQINASGAFDFRRAV